MEIKSDCDPGGLGVYFPSISHTSCTWRKYFIACYLANWLNEWITHVEVCQWFYFSFLYCLVRGTTSRGVERRVGRAPGEFFTRWVIKWFDWQHCAKRLRRAVIGRCALYNLLASKLRTVLPPQTARQRHQRFVCRQGDCRELEQHSIDSSSLSPSSCFIFPCVFVFFFGWSSGFPCEELCSAL